MKKILFFLFIVCTLASCSNTENEIQQFAYDFSQAITNNDRSAILRMYPKAEKCDFFNVVSCSKDSIVVKETETKGTYVANFNDSCNVTIKDEGNGTYTILDSHGVVKFNASKLRFGMSTGWIEEGMDDQAILERFADDKFIDYVKGLAGNSLSSQVSIIDWDWDNYSMSGTPLTITVKNNTEMEIKKNQYSISGSFSVQGIFWYKVTAITKNIKPGETARLQFNVPGEWPDTDLKADIQFSPSIKLNVDDEKMLNTYKATGKEYAEYKSKLSK